MVFHLVAYTSSDAASLGLTTLGTITDGTVTPRGNGYIVPAFAKNLAGCYGLGATMNRFQVQSPTLRANWPIDVAPIDVGTTVSTMPPWLDWFDSPVPMTIGEELDIQRVNSILAAERDYVLVWLEDAPAVPYNGTIQPIRTTSTTTVTANAWSLCPLTFPTPLPSENYYVVGARFHSTTSVAGRLWFPGYGHRPGAMGFSTVLKHDGNAFRLGNKGIWGQFNVASPPQAEFLCTAADTTEIVDLDLVPIG